MSEPEVLFSSATLTFIQDGNTMGTTQDTEVLEVQFLTQIPGEDPFMVLKTEGWSINTEEELSQILVKARQAIEGLLVG